jgi:hypothetical protein
MKTKTKHPMQPVEYVDRVIRFKKNKVVRYLLDAGGIDLNAIVGAFKREGFSVEDMEQFYQLIGYSVSGFGDLSIVRPETVAAADALVGELLDGNS